MAWSIFSQGGGPGAAFTWAVNLLKDLSAPTTTGNEQLVFDWEESEGGGGEFNPLNQGPVPGSAQLTSSGAQFGGGAADYVSWSAGLQGAVDYLSMPSFVAIADALRQNNPSAARADIIASPWAASHYDNGASFADTPLPGQQTALAAAGGSAETPSSSSSSTPSTASALNGLGSDIKTYAIVVPIVIGGAALVVWGFGRLSGSKQPKTGAAAAIGALALWISHHAPPGLSGAPARKPSQQHCTTPARYTGA